MPKKDKEKAASLPKQIAGVKIPKALREQLTALARNPLVADLLAAGLVALAASLRDNPKVKKAAADAKGKATGVASGVAKAAANVADVATKFGAAVTEAAATKPAAKPAPVKKPATKAPAKKAATSKAAAAKPAASRARPKTAD
jgi:hypothetical protein